MYSEPKRRRSTSYRLRGNMSRSLPARLDAPANRQLLILNRGFGAMSWKKLRIIEYVNLYIFHKANIA